MVDEGCFLTIGGCLGGGHRTVQQEGSTEITCGTLIPHQPTYLVGEEIKSTEVDSLIKVAC